MRRRDSYLGGSTLLRPRNPYAFFRHLKRRKAGSGALHKLTGEEYAAEIRRCDRERTSVDMASNLTPYVAKAVTTISSKILASALEYVKDKKALPVAFDRMILMDVAIRLGRHRLEESKRRLIRSIAIDMVLKLPRAKR